jgi:hypothetical protein
VNEAWRAGQLRVLAYLREDPEHRGHPIHQNARKNPGNGKETVRESRGRMLWTALLERAASGPSAILERFHQVLSLSCLFNRSFASRYPR